MLVNEEIRQKLSQLVKRAWSDDQLKHRLLNDPEPLFRENGVDIPRGMKPRVVVDKESISFEFLPKTAADGAELTENALGAVAGGGTNTKSSSTSASAPVKYSDTQPRAGLHNERAKLTQPGEVASGVLDNEHLGKHGEDKGSYRSRENERDEREHLLYDPPDCPFDLLDDVHRSLQA